MDADGDKIREVHEVICSIGKDELLLEITEENLEMMKYMMSQNNFKEVIGFNASCYKNGGEKVVDVSIAQLDQLHARIATAGDC